MEELTRVFGDLNLTEFKIKHNSVKCFGAKMFFDRWTKPEEIALKKTYLNKPLVRDDDTYTFAELAIANSLSSDGWLAYWIDSFHGKVWTDFPARSQLNIPT